MTTLTERFEQYKKDRDVSKTKGQLDDFNANERQAIKLEAAAMREERAMKGEERISQARARLAKARTTRSQNRPPSMGGTIKDIIWPVKKGAKGKKKGRSEIAEILWPTPRKGKKKARKKDSIFDGLF